MNIKKFASFSLNAAVVLLFGAAMILPEITITMREEVVDRDILTMEETVALSKLLHFPLYLHLYEMANPEALPTLRMIFSDPEYRSSDFNERANMACLIGYLGEADDVDLLMTGLAELKGEQRYGRISYIFKILEALAVMADRGVPGAEEALLDFVSPERWKELPFTLEAPVYDPNADLFRKYGGPIDAIKAYARYANGDMQTLRDQLLAEVEDEDAREYILSELPDNRPVKRATPTGDVITPVQRRYLNQQVGRFKKRGML